MFCSWLIEGDAVRCQQEGAYSIIFAAHRSIVQRTASGVNER